MRLTQKHRYLRITAALAVMLVVLLATAMYALPHLVGKHPAHVETKGSEIPGKYLKKAESDLGVTLPRKLAGAGSKLFTVAESHSAGLVSKRVGSNPAVDKDQIAIANYRSAVQCREYVYAKQKIANIPRASEVSRPDYADALAEQLDEIEAIVQQTKQQCEGRSLGELNKALFEYSLQAGVSGDLGAQSCLVHGEFFSSDAYENNDGWKKEYMEYAPQFMEHGIDVGYWPTVYAGIEILMDGFGQLPPWLNDLPHPDPYRVYRAAQLTYYRSNGEGADKLRDVLVRLADRYNITSAQRAEADHWAQVMYQQRFAKSPALDPWNAKFCP